MTHALTFTPLCMFEKELKYLLKVKSYPSSFSLLAVRVIFIIKTAIKFVK